MIRVLVVVCVCVVLSIVNTEAGEILAGAPYVANYASSYNSHIINHDIRYPIAAPVLKAAPAVAPAVVQPVARIASVPFAQLTSLPFTQLASVPLTQFERVAPVQISQVPLAQYPAPPVAALGTVPVAGAAPAQVAQVAPVAGADLRPATIPVNTPLQFTPGFRAVADPNVEPATRSDEERESPNTPELSRSTLARQSQSNDEASKANAPSNLPAPRPVPSAVLASSQIFSRQLLQQSSLRNPSDVPNVPQQPRQKNLPGLSQDDQQGFSARNVAIPQQQRQRSNAPLTQAFFADNQAPKGRFWVAENAFPNSEKANNEDSESVEVNAQPSLAEVPASDRKETQPRNPAQPQPRARIVFSPNRILETPLVPSAYTQIITF